MTRDIDRDDLERIADQAEVRLREFATHAAIEAARVDTALDKMRDQIDMMQAEAVQAAKEQVKAIRNMILTVAVPVFVALLAAFLAYVATGSSMPPH